MFCLQKRTRTNAETFYFNGVLVKGKKKMDEKICECPTAFMRWAKEREGEKK